jgi:hypothetical protein
MKRRFRELDPCQIDGVNIIPVSIAYEVIQTPQSYNMDVGA